VTYFRALDRSRTAFIQVARALPARVAAASYRAFLSGVTRSAIRSVSGFSMGGLPLGRLGSMRVIIGRTNNPCNPPLIGI
jgi:hypothetical protein